MRRKAFTLLEILTVIGIIAILVTLLTLGLSHIGKTGREKTTRVALENLRNMVAERGRTGGGTKALDALFQTGGWTAGGNPNGQMVAPGNADNLPAPLLTQGNSGPEPQNASGATLLVMNLLKAMPDNARMLAGLPSNTVRSFSGAVSGANPPSVVTAPFLLDGWGHPILYVPTGGLTGAYVTGNDGKAEARLKTSPDGRGFWVSAGPDGFYGILPGPNGQIDAPPGSVDDIPGADDNVYSIDN